MMAELIDRKRLKMDMRSMLRTAQVSPRAMVFLYAGLILVINLISSVVGGGTAAMGAGAAAVAGGVASAAYSGVNLLGTFTSVLMNLVAAVLGTGFVLYCMAIRRGERAEYLTLFDGFSFVGRLILLNLLIYVFVSLWSMLFFFPGLIAAYRYRFAIYNLCENPELTPLQALNMSKLQTIGYKNQLFLLDLSYLGWIILGSLPIAVEGFFLGAEMAMPFSPVVSVLIQGVWQMVVYSLFLPTMQCTELGYFEAAKRTSGVYFNPGQGGNATEL